MACAFERYHGRLYLLASQDRGSGWSSAPLISPTPGTLHPVPTQSVSRDQWVLKLARDQKWIWARHLKGGQLCSKFSELTGSGTDEAWDIVDAEEDHERSVHF